MKRRQRITVMAFAVMFIAVAFMAGRTFAADKKPNIIMLMTDDTGWNDFGCSGSGRGPRPSDTKRRSHGQGRCCFYLLVRPGELHGWPRVIHYRAYSNPLSALGRGGAGRPELPQKGNSDYRRILQENGYQTSFSGKWHLGDTPVAYPIEHGFDEMKAFAASYPGVYTYSNTSTWFHPWFPSFNKEYAKAYFEVVNMFEWEGVAGKPAKKVAEINWDYLANFDVRQADFAIE